MKKTYTFLLFLLQLQVFSQYKEVIILDSVTKNPINLSHITYPNLQIGSISNEEGRVKIPKKQDSIFISHINYKEKHISYSDFVKQDTIYLT